MILKKYCEHELNLYDEEWINEHKVRVKIKCDLCGQEFVGVLE